MRRYEVDRRGIRGLKARVGRECCINTSGQMGKVAYWKYVYLEEWEEEDTVLVGVELPEKAGTQQGEQLQE